MSKNKSGLYRLYAKDNGDHVGPFETPEEAYEYAKAEGWTDSDCVIQKREYAPWTDHVKTLDLVRQESANARRLAKV